MLNVRAATKTFEARGRCIPALQQAELDAPTGAWTAVLGPSGSGKTTLLRAIAGFERLDSGTISLDDAILDAPGRHVAAERRGIGIVAQDGALFPHLDVAGNVGFGLARGATRRTPAGRRRHSARVGELLDLVGLAGYERRRVHELSGGQQQRVALARALAPAPGVVLLDEPFSALDASLRAELREEVRGLLRQLGVTVVLVTHDQEEALSLADHIAVMRDGRVTQAGRPRDVYRMPCDLDTACFLGEAVLLSGTVVASGTAAHAEVDCPLGRLPIADGAPAAADPDGRCLVMLRPEQLRVARAGGVVARVVGGSFFGHDAVLRARLGPTGAGPLVLARTMRDELPDVDALVHLSVDGFATTYPDVAAGRQPALPAAEAHV
jgi:iron(III) transport system ATP-binding protein